MSKYANRYGDASEAVNRLKKLKSSKNTDPDRFLPGKAQAGKALKYVFVILGPVEEGDAVYDPVKKVAGGRIAEIGMDGAFAVKGGVHWYSNQPTGCPRILSNESCRMCDAGWDLLKEHPKDGSEENKKIRSAISKTWIGKEQFLVNIYFPPEFNQFNPPEVQGRVMYTELPQAVLNKAEEVLANDPELAGAVAGVFYDPTRSFPIQMVVKCGNGGYNNYENSMFLNNPFAIADTDEGIDEIFSRRHDLFTKIAKIDTEQLDRIAAALAGVDSSSTTGEEGNTTLISEVAGDGAETIVEPEPEPEPVPTPTPVKAATAAKPAAGIPAAKPPVTAAKPAAAAPAKAATTPAKPATAAAPAARTAAAPAKAPVAAPAARTPPPTKAATTVAKAPVKPPVTAPVAEEDGDANQLASILEGLDS